LESNLANKPMFHNALCSLFILILFCR